MKNKITAILTVVLSISIGVVGSYLVFQGEDAAGEADATVKGTRVVKTDSDGSVKKIKEISLITKEDGKHAVRIVETSQPRPNLSPSVETASEDIDEEDLSEGQKAVMKELQDALDDNNLRRVRNALKKFVASAERGGLEGKVPVCMRAKAVDALGWFGKEAAVDLIAFVADGNEEVSNDAFSAFEQALSDCEMGDRERAQLLTSVMTALDDADQVESLLCQLNDMRNSVKAEAASVILQTGSKNAKAQLLEEMDVYFDDEVTDVGSLEKWKAMNPDDPDDPEIYGGEKN